MRGRRTLAVAVVSAVLVGAALLLTTGCGGGAHHRYQVPTSAMVPTIKAGDIVSADLDAYRSSRPQRGDIIVFRPTTSAAASCGVPTGNPFVKRVVAVGGDSVEVRRVVAGGNEVIRVLEGEDSVRERPAEPGTKIGRLFVNDRSAPDEAAITPRYAYARRVVPAGALFVLGDNRDLSCDSHLWEPDPFVPLANVIGRVNR